MGGDIIVGHYGGVTSVTPCLHARSTFTSALTSAETCLLILDICTHLYTFVLGMLALSFKDEGLALSAQNL